MAEERRISPEKQLLKLIEDPKGNNTANKVKVKRRSLILFSPGAWLSRMTFFKRKVNKWRKAPSTSSLDLKTINRLLVVCVLGLAVYFGWSFYNSAINVNTLPDLEISVDAKGESLSPQLTSVAKNSGSYYLDKMAYRDIFKMGRREESAEQEVTIEADESQIIAATQHLKLVGISWSNDPDAMIEDSNALHTFFIKKGQMIGDVKVEAIFKDKVVLSYKGEETELR